MVHLTPSLPSVQGVVVLEPTKCSRDETHLNGINQLFASTTLVDTFLYTLRCDTLEDLGVYELPLSGGKM